MASFLDNMKGKFNAAGKEAKKLTRIGQLKMDLLQAKGALEDRHRALGEIAANRLLDRNESSLGKNDPAVAEAMEQVKEARLKLKQIEGDLEAVKAT